MIFSPFYGGYIILELHCPHSPHLISFFLYKKKIKKKKIDETFLAHLVTPGVPPCTNFKFSKSTENPFS
jgi:hypothetical protein